MNTNLWKRAVCVLLCALAAATLAGCGAKKSAGSASAGVDVREKLTSLTVSDEALGVAGKYAALSEIRDGSVDPDLVGTWTTADGEMTYTFTQDGREIMSSTYIEDAEVPFTCMTAGGHKLLCEELSFSPESDENVKKAGTKLVYKAYSVENDALYQVTVDETREEKDTVQSSLVMLYRADATGSAAAAIAANLISVDALSGSWTSEKGSLTIRDGKLKCGKDSFSLRFDEQNRLVAEKGGRETAYKIVLSVQKDYAADTAQAVESMQMNLTYTGANGLDKPNLQSVLDDWKKEYSWDSWYYTGKFTLQAE